MSDGMRREFTYLSSHATNRYFIPNWGKSVAEYAAWCAEHVREASPKLLMQGLGEVLNDAKSKTFVKNKLIDETSSALELFSAFPIIYKE